ncbi:DUF4145 domain-containing protein [Shouchella clausii]|uniref:DUF4145 domain-containing protein n=1 Tax=Shouchella clausii TaxID=79880 RepID=UPI00079B62C6|nr:DUF4145 domain-containing protein [Shouchella clausii]KKI87547.1 hypothetical protein WZ76_03440 [Shouchella clausii]
MNKYIFPKLGSKYFNCPHCDVYAEHRYKQVYYSKSGYDYENDIKLLGLGGPSLEPLIQLEEESTEIYLTNCEKCNEFILWLGKKQLYPKISSLPLPVEGMPVQIKSLYEEASSIFENSPRAAAALVRLAIEDLITELGAKGRNLSDKIDSFCEGKELPSDVKGALNAIRIYGNKGIHNVEIDMQDDKDSVRFLFELLNLIVQEAIVNPQKRETFFAMIPEKFKGK